MQPEAFAIASRDESPNKPTPLPTEPYPVPQLTLRPLPSSTPSQIWFYPPPGPSLTPSAVEPSEAALILRGIPTPSTHRAATTATSILFVSTRDGIADIYQMNEDGTGQVRLIMNGRNNQSPSWSPDGQQIAFLSSEVGTGSVTTAHLYVVNSEGAGPSI